MENGTGQESDDHDIISNRAVDAADPNFHSYIIEKSSLCKRNPFCAKKNPTGMINLGSAQNKLMDDVLNERMSRLAISKSGFHYFPPSGLPLFRRNLASFLSQRLKADEPLDPEHLFVLLGSMSGITCLGHVLAQDGDFFLVPSPFYEGIKNGLGQMARVKVVPVHLANSLMASVGERKGKEDQLISEITTRMAFAFDSAESQGKKVRGIFLTNPGNPIGTCISRRAILTVLEFAYQRHLHVVFDEVYAMSVISDPDSFHSVASLSRALPDPSRVHLIWSFSKDICVSGFRCGVVYSWSKVVAKAMASVSVFYMTPSPVQLLLNSLISDAEWLDQVFFPTNFGRLKEAKDHMTSELLKLGAEVRDTNAGLFLWVNLTKMLPPSGNPYSTGERDLCRDLLSATGCLVVPADVFEGEDTEWARVLFSVGREIREEFLKRLKDFKEKVIRGVYEEDEGNH